MRREEHKRTNCINNFWSHCSSFVVSSSAWSKKPATALVCCAISTCLFPLKNFTKSTNNAHKKCLSKVNDELVIVTTSIKVEDEASHMVWSTLGRLVLTTHELAPDLGITSGSWIQWLTEARPNPQSGNDWEPLPRQAWLLHRDCGMLYVTWTHFQIK